MHFVPWIFQRRRDSLALLWQSERSLRSSFHVSSILRVMGKSRLFLQNISTHCVPHTLNSIRCNGTRLSPKLFSIAWVHPSFRETRIYELFDSSWSVDPSLQGSAWLVPWGWPGGDLVKYHLFPEAKRYFCISFSCHILQSNQLFITVINWTQVPEWSTPAKALPFCERDNQFQRQKST